MIYRTFLFVQGLVGGEGYLDLVLRAFKRVELIQEIRCRDAQDLRLSRRTCHIAGWGVAIAMLLGRHQVPQIWHTECKCNRILEEDRRTISASRELTRVVSNDRILPKRSQRKAPKVQSPEGRGRDLGV